jgi:Amt family ammonium transporter
MAVGALITFMSLGGFLLYFCGLTRAKNSGHTCMLVLVGVLFGLTGYWIGGFAVQMGGIGNSHAALNAPISTTVTSVLDYEVGPFLFGHHWGLFGSSGFFLVTDDSARAGAGLLFLVQAALLAISLAAALGGALERGKLMAMAICSYLIGLVVYPLLANWVWGGGWLAELGREFGLGHGYVDIGGAGVVHETAGILALVYAVALGPRHVRFVRNAPSFTLPGHNVPFIVLGALILLVSWMGSNAFASTGLVSDASSPVSSGAGVAAINTLLAAIGGLVTSFIQSAWQKNRPDPAWLCRGLLGGAVASCGGAALLDPWAAFVIGCVAALLIQQAVLFLIHKRLDDPASAAAVHATGGAWGVFSVGLFANGAAGDGLNGMPHEVRGLFYGGAWHQLVAQMFGGVTSFVVICILGYAAVTLVQRIIGLRVGLEEETTGLDWSETGALGYQGDIEIDDENGK